MISILSNIILGQTVNKLILFYVRDKFFFYDCMWPRRLYVTDSVYGISSSMW